jgi:hypothetical protein
MLRQQSQRETINGLLAQVLGECTTLKAFLIVRATIRDFGVLTVRHHNALNRSTIAI